MLLWAHADERGISPCDKYAISREGKMVTQAHITTRIGRVLLGLAVLWGIMGLSGGRSWAHDSDLDRETLRGLQGVEVIVADIKPEVERAGLTQQQLQTDVELQLRKAAIPLLTSAERVQVPGKLFLAVEVHVVPRADGLLAAYAISVELYQVASLETEACKAIVSTWSVGATGSIGLPLLDTLRDSVKDSVAHFIHAYRSVNLSPVDSTAPAATAPRRDLTRQVQQRLQAVGFNPGSIDGAMGPQTQQALRWFQNSKGLRPTGEPDEATLDALSVR
jgi:Putative peptidoglycan binding domain